MYYKQRRKKKKSQQQHAKRRSMERFGCSFDADGMVSDIKKGKLKPICQQSLRLTVFRCIIGGQDAACVYDKQRKTIVTVFPYSWTQKPEFQSERI
jgi:hypothetical protein